ncbi:MAG: phosphoribosyltransferase family protein, partial [Syntrophomonadaceae bacterium]|nr:phosphoribosyltransferase family protein [Syntrophomonadaceae bacterium]
VLAIPRGGVEVAHPIARELKAPLDLIIPRKIGAPFNPELAIGAVAPDGTTLLQPGWESFGLDEERLRQVVERELKEIQRRMTAYRGEVPEPAVEGRTVILVDDGIATGFTVEAALESLRRRPLQKLILAVPVAPPDTVRRLQPKVDEIVCLLIPHDFYAVGQFYDDFGQTEDAEVVRLLKDSARTGRG